jgi:hypothetical protein
MKYNIEITLTGTHCDGVYWLGKTGGYLSATPHLEEARRFGSEGEAFSFSSYMIGTCTTHKIVSHGTWAIVPAPDTF